MPWLAISATESWRGALPITYAPWPRRRFDGSQLAMEFALDAPASIPRDHNASRAPDLL